MKPPARSSNPIQKAWHDDPGVVYFMGAGNPPVAIKIGVANASKIANRFRKHQSSNHETLELLGIIRFADTLSAETRERELHTQFKHLWRFEHGWLASEWLTSSDDLLAFIKNNAESPRVLDLPTIVARPLPRG